MKKNRHISILLLAAMLCGTLLSSCGSTVEPTSVNTGTTEETPAPETVPEWVLPDMDFAGESVTFLLRRTANDWSADDVIADEIDGTPVNDAVFNRNVWIEETYNVHIEGYDAPTGRSVYEPALNSILAEDHAFDVSTSNRYDAVNLLTEGLLLDLRETEYIHLDESWWNPFYNESASILGRQYYALGDISRVYKLGVRCLFFNKELAEDLQIPDLYETVLAGNWDYETFFSTAELANIDMDGSGIMDNADCYGIQAQSSLGIFLAKGGGLQLTDKDAEDQPVLVIQTEANLHLLETLSNFMNTHNNSIYTCDNWQTTQTRFAAGQVLFQAEVMLLIEALRAEEVNVGILPMPKQEKSQDTYISYLDSNCQIVYALPVTCADSSMVSFVLEAMAQKSMDTLTPAFYDICLDGKYIRDEESSDMLDIIFAFCRTESAEAFGWGNLYSNLKTAITKGTIASTIQSGCTAAEAAIAKTMETLTSRLERD